MSSAGLDSAYTLQKSKRDLFHSPFILLSLSETHANTGSSQHTHIGPTNVTPDISNSVIQQKKNIYSVIFQKDALCCLDATSFFHLYSPIEVESQYSAVLWLLAAC